LSQEFLLNFKRSSLDLALALGVSGYFWLPVAQQPDTPTAQRKKRNRDNPEQIIKLPPYQNVNASLGVTIRARRSLRQFTGRPMPLQELSTILFYGNGVTGDMPMISEDDDTEWPKHSLAASRSCPYASRFVGRRAESHISVSRSSNVATLEDEFMSTCPSVIVSER